MSDDLISRQAVIKEIESLDFTMSKCLTKEECYGMNRAKEAVINCIRDLPKVQQKTGHWICDYKGDHVADYHCSECGRQLGFAFSTQNKKILGGRWKYCDVCGAKMEGEVE